MELPEPLKPEPEEMLTMAPFPSFLHGRGYRPHHLVGPDDVDREDLVEVFAGQAFQVVVGHNFGAGGVVHQAVNPAPAGQGLGRHAPAVFIHGNVGPAQDGLAAQFPAGRRRFLGLRLAAGVVDDHVAALGSQAPDYCRAQAGGRAGYDEYAACQVHEIYPLLGFYVGLK